MLDGLKTCSKKRIRDAFPHLDDNGVDSLYGLIRGAVKTRSFVSVQVMERQCHNPPGFVQRAMTALNEILCGHGVEAIRASRWWDDYYGDCIAEYVNMGDTYSATILYNNKTGRFCLTSLGDWAEKRRDLA